MNGYGGDVDINQIQQMKQLEEMKKQLMIKILTKEAYERLGRVRSVNPTLAAQAEAYLLQIYQTGLNRKITDDEMKEILKNVSSVTQKTDFRIKRK